MDPFFWKVTLRKNQSCFFSRPIVEMSAIFTVLWVIFAQKCHAEKKGRKMIIFHKRGQKNHLFSVKKTMNDSFFCGLKLFLILSFDVIWIPCKILVNFMQLLGKPFLLKSITSLKDMLRKKRLCSFGSFYSKGRCQNLDESGTEHVNYGLFCRNR